MEFEFKSITAFGRKFRIWVGIDETEFLAFISQVEFLESGCWRWTGKTTSPDEGYGRFYYKGHDVRAHRFCFLALRGPIPHGLHLHHRKEAPVRCMGPACVCPDHLSPLSPVEHFAIHGKTLGVKPRGGPCHKGHNNWRMYTDPHGFTSRKCRDCEHERGQKAKAKFRETHPITRGVICKNGHPHTEENGYWNGKQWICRVCRVETMQRYKVRAAAGEVERKTKTNCINGHEYTPENTILLENGERRCKTCARDAYEPRQRAAKTHCAQGHPWIPENIYEYPNTKGGVNRACKICWAERRNKYQSENRETVIASKRSYYERKKIELNRKKRESRSTIVA